MSKRSFSRGFSRYAMFFVACVLICARSAGQQSQAHTDPAKLFRLGQDALARNELADAESAFRAVLAVDPTSAAAYANLGVVEMRRKNWDKAVANLHSAEKLAPKMTGVRLNL